jgi:predicted dehydrogenase
VVAVTDADPAARDYVAAHAPSASFFGDLEALLATARPEAVLVAIPTLHHREAVLASIAAGAHTYLEKPIASTSADAAAIVDAWKPTGLIGRIGFNLRFSRLSSDLKSALNRGDIGEPVGARTSWTARFPVESGWRMSPREGGGALLELASHHIDLMRFLFDSEIESVAAQTWSNRGDDEAAMLTLAMGNGVHVQSFVSYGTVEEDRVEIYGTEGKLTINRYDSLIVERTGPHATGGINSAKSRMLGELSAIKHGFARRNAAGQEPSFSASIGSFIESVRRSAHGPPDFTDGLRALEVVEAAREAAREHTTVKVVR